MPVDSFKYLPRLIAAFYKMTEVAKRHPIPWTTLAAPLAECTFGLVTSAGLYVPAIDPPFDLEHERQQPTWGDPSFRCIPYGAGPQDVSISHLHINGEAIQRDLNIVFPRDRMREFAAEGRIGGLAEDHFSFMGYQGFPPDTSAWEQEYAPRVAESFKTAGVSCVVLTPV